MKIILKSFLLSLLAVAPTIAFSKPIRCDGFIAENAPNSQTPSQRQATIYFELDKKGDLWFGSREHPFMSRQSYSPMRTIQASGTNQRYITATSEGQKAGPPFAGAKYYISASLALGTPLSARISLSLIERQSQRDFAFVSTGCN